MIAPALTPATEEIKEIVRLCRTGRLYDVERWIADGKSLDGIVAKNASSRNKASVRPLLEMAVSGSRGRACRQWQQIRRKSSHTCATPVLPLGKLRLRAEFLLYPTARRFDRTACKGKHRDHERSEGFRPSTAQISPVRSVELIIAGAASQTGAAGDAVASCPELHAVGNAQCRGCSKPPIRCSKPRCPGLLHHVKLADGDQSGCTVWTGNWCVRCG